ncbi:TonB-dependent receptor [Pedobacter chitinilyticus]|uniref:TonB-dependent receptor n=1 Tax=Pedobacter chitinilyticus TaxID=2233776 RepID=A0A3S3SS51_9SPHI|nr:TonB-dependent receptor [Pedobacter chitinilyticus]RWU08116.1 TonB-dependent receptor [Pedobacter chitinilyticus]
MKLKYLLVMLFVGLYSYSYAQKRTVTGVIKDQQGTLPGVSITLKNGKIGTSTNIFGEFRLSNLPTGDQTLVITSIGYVTQEKMVTINDSAAVKLDAIVLISNQRTLNQVVVNGIGSNRASEARALNMQKTSPRIVNVIAADGIGKLPDRNAGEAVQRIPGVVLERDQGEGRFVSLRGLPAEWSAATINGDRIPTAEEQTTSRSTAFDFFPSELIQFVEVSKAITPDMEGDAMGGSINFITRTSVDKKTLNFSAGGGYNAYAHGGSYSGNILYGDRSKNGKIGFVLNGTIWNRDWATDNFEPRFSGNKIARMELRDYFGTRQTLGFNGAADYKIGQRSKLYVRGLFGKLNDDEKHNKLRLRYENGRAEAQSIHNILNYRMYGGDFGGNFELGRNSSLDFKLSHYNNDFNYGDLPNKEFPSYYLVQYNQTNVPYVGRDADNFTRYQIDGGPINPESPQTLLPSQNTVNNSSNYSFNSVQMEIHHINETDRIVAQTNYKIKVMSNLELKFGAKFRDKKRTERYELPTWTWDNKGGTQPAPAYTSLNLIDKPYANDYLKNIGSQYTGIFPKFIAQNDLDGFFDKYRNNLKVDSVGSALLANGAQVGSNFDVYEKHTAAYGMGTWEVSNKFTVIAGLRAERTDLRVDGWLYETVAGQPNYRGKLTPQTKYNDYTTLLPMLHLKYSPNQNLNLRLAATKTFSRPDFGSLVAGGTYKLQDNVLTYGNPGLSPIKSYNLDIMAEYYFGDVGAISAGAFYKNVKDPIFSSSQLYSSFNGYDNVRVLQDQNGQDANVGGFELGFSKKLDFLPGVLSGIGINANYTFIRSKMQITDRGGSVRIPGQSNDLFNVALFYEKGALQARVALNHKGVNIIAHGASAKFDEYLDKNTTMDANISVKLSKRLQLFGEANNLLNTRFRFYYGTPERPTQVEYYGIRGQMGIRANIF